MIKKKWILIFLIGFFVFYFSRRWYSICGEWSFNQ